MAVYKPNYCYPYLEPVDLTIPYGEKYFTCQIDTSNIAITGYKIEVYDENNTVVFPHKDNKNKISPVSELPIVTNIDGLNGSELRIPFIQHFDDKITTSYNAIYFKATNYVDYYQPMVESVNESGKKIFYKNNGILIKVDGMSTLKNEEIQQEYIGRYILSNGVFRLVTQDTYKDIVTIKQEGDNKVGPETYSPFVELVNESGKKIFYKINGILIEVDGTSTLTNEEIQKKYIGKYILSNGVVCLVTQDNYKDIVTIKQEGGKRVGPETYSSFVVGGQLFESIGTPLEIDGCFVFVGDILLMGQSFYTADYDGLRFDGSISGTPIVYVKGGDNYAGKILQGENLVESAEGVWCDANGATLALSNQGKTYKWQITLYSGDKGLLIKPDESNKDLKYVDYDNMADSEFNTLLSSGTILGSTEDRIQGPISDKIYAKQWLQLLRQDANGNWLQVGTRTYIESYSQSLGHIYPISGDSRGFSNDDLYGHNPATHFAVYKYSNDPEHITSQNSVDQSINFQLTAHGAAYDNEAKNYFYTVTGNTRKEALDNIKLFNKQCDGQNTTRLCELDAEDKALHAGESVLIWNGKDSSGNILTDNPLTGYFTIQYSNPEVTYKTKDGAGVDKEVTERIPKFTFDMAYAYRKVSSYIGKVFFVKDGSFTNQNIVSKAEATGVNDVASLGSPIDFVEEEPLEIYPNNKDKFYGEIFKNSAGKIYVSPFVGLQTGARLYVSDGTVIKATDVDTTNWAVTYNPESPASTTPYSSIDPLKYEIRTNFKSSDETPFYAYDSPRIVPWVLENLAVANEHGHEFLLESGGEILTVPILCSQKVERRYVEVGGQYLQAQNKSWTSYRWLLVDTYGNIIQDTGKQYDGAIKTTFYGLDGPTPKAVNNHEAIPNVYYVVLIVEDELGNILLMGIKIKVTIDPTDLVAQFSGEFDCKTHSVKLGIQDYGYPALSKDDNNQAIKLGDSDGVVTVTGASSYVGLQGVDEGVNTEGSPTETPSWKAASKMALPLEGAQLKRFFKYEANQISDITQNPSKMVANKEGKIEFHTQVELDANFCGDIFTYVVDIGDRFGNTDKLRISLALPENFSHHKGAIKA